MSDIKDMGRGGDSLVISGDVSGMGQLRAVSTDVQQRLHL